jgi:hypothetical protein
MATNKLDIDAATPDNAERLAKLLETEQPALWEHWVQSEAAGGKDGFDEIAPKIRSFLFNSYDKSISYNVRIDLLLEMRVIACRTAGEKIENDALALWKQKERSVTDKKIKFEGVTPEFAAQMARLLHKRNPALWDYWIELERDWKAENKPFYDQIHIEAGWFLSQSLSECTSNELVSLEFKIRTIAHELAIEKFIN